MNHQDLLAAVSYDVSTGVFTRNTARGNAKAGSVIGNPDSKGYLKTLLLGEYVKLHRLAWFYVHNAWPESQLDHINGIRSDNRIVNLRECDTSQNCLNQHGPRSNNTLGVQGVRKVKKTGRYRATCTVQGVRHHLGVFATQEEAEQAYRTFKAPHLPER